jgi:hypothetical protein
MTLCDESRNVGVKVLNSIVVDIDDTLIGTDKSMQGIWHKVLDREIPLEMIETLGLEQIFMKYASSEQKACVNELQKRFWDILLCVEDAGVELVKLQEPIPFAAGVLQKWSKQCMLVYLTGRTENTRDLTLRELERFGFPTDNTQLLMFSLEDYARVRGVNPSGPTLVEAKARLMATISKEQSVVRVVDDYPGYFPVYKQFGIPDRIGLLRRKRYSLQDYVDQGATRVVESWKQLRDDLPMPT